MGNFIGKVFDPNSMDYDIKTIDPENLFFKKIMKKKEEMNGWDRIEMIFSRNEFDEISPELMRVKDATLIAFFVGGMMGGIGRSRIAYMDFFRQNVATTFETPLQAKRALQDKVTLGMGSGAWRVGWRISAFTFMYMTASTLITAYRGKAGILDQVGGAGVAGFLYKFKDGPKAAVSGTVVGGALGLVSGSLTFLAIKTLGMDFDKANLEYYARLARKQEAEHQKTLQLRESQQGKNNLHKFHDQLLGGFKGPEALPNDGSSDEGTPQKANNNNDLKQSSSANSSSSNNSSSSVLAVAKA